MSKFKEGVVSVLVFPYANKLEIRVTRSYGFSERPSKINIYSANYKEIEKAKRLAVLANRLNGLVMLKMISSRVMVSSPLV